MHPDAIIDGLRRELDRLDKDADDYADRKKAIDAEIKRADGLDRPEATAEEPDTVADPNIAYLGGLKRELQRVEESARDAVKAEIKRVEALIHKTEKEADVADDKPSEQEIEQRKQARTGRKVERATNDPKPAPAGAKE